MVNYAPFEYDLLFDSCNGYAPSVDLIEAIAYSSGDSVFHSFEFWDALREYRKNGCKKPNK